MLWEHVDVILQRADTLIGLGVRLESAAQRTAGQQHLQVAFSHIKKHHRLDTQLQEMMQGH